MHQLTPGPHLDDILEPYRSAERTPPAGRPWVLANMVSGLDGCAAVRGRVGALSDDVDQRLFRSLRSLADTVLVGAETVREERYGTVRLPEALRDERRSAGRPAVPRLAIVTRSLALDLGASVFADADEDARPLVVTCAASDPGRRRALSDVADVLVAGDASVDLGAALQQLRDQGDRVVLCEGGPALLGQLVESGHLDELCLTLAPVMGGDALPVAVSTVTSDLSRYRLAHVLRAGDELFTRYERTSGR